MRNADEINHFTWVGYHYNQPFSIFRNARLNYNHWASWDFGGTPLYQAVNMNAHATFTNFWNFGTGLNYEFRDVSTRALFGGPNLRKIPGLANWFYAGTDQRKKVSLNVDGFNAWGFQNSVRSFGMGIWLRVQPTNALNFSIGPNYNSSRREIQYVTDFDLGNGTEYLVGDVEQNTFSMTMRLNYNITPNLTIQFYGQPFISKGNYKDYKIITDPMADLLQDQFVRIPSDQLLYHEQDEYFDLDYDGDGTVDIDFGNPDFNFIQFRSNLVARWEYIPGSELFLVWSQNNTNFGDPTQQLASSLLDNLFENQASNIFLLKWTYRFVL